MKHAWNKHKNKYRNNIFRTKTFPYFHWKERKETWKESMFRNEKSVDKTLQKANKFPIYQSNWKKSLALKNTKDSFKKRLSFQTFRKYNLKSNIQEEHKISEIFPKKYRVSNSHKNIIFILQASCHKNQKSSSKIALKRTVTYS